MAQKDFFGILPFRVPPRQKSFRDERRAVRKGWFVNPSKAKTRRKRYKNRSNDPIGLALDLGFGNLAHDQHPGCLFWLEVYDTGLIGSLPSSPLKNQAAMDRPGCLLSARMLIRAFKHPPKGKRKEWIVWRVMKVFHELGKHELRPNPEQDKEVVRFPLHLYPKVSINAMFTPLVSCAYAQRDFDTLYAAWKKDAKQAHRRITVRLFADEPLGGDPTTEPGDLVASLKNPAKKREHQKPTTLGLDLTELFQRRQNEEDLKVDKKDFEARKRAAKRMEELKIHRPTRRVACGEFYFSVHPPLVTVRKGAKLTFRWVQMHEIATDSNKLPKIPAIRLRVYKADDPSQGFEPTTGFGNSNLRHRPTITHTFTFNTPGRWIAEGAHHADLGDGLRYHLGRLPVEVLTEDQALEAAHSEGGGLLEPVQALKNLERHEALRTAIQEYGEKVLKAKLSDTQKSRERSEAKRLKKLIEDLKAFLTVHEPVFKDREIVRCRAFHASRENPALPVTELQCCLVAATPEKEAVAFNLVDWTNTDKSNLKFKGMSGVYFGEGGNAEDAMQAAIEEWGEECGHPEGLISVYVQTGKLTGFEFEAECDGRNWLETLEVWLDRSSLPLALLGTILMVVPLPGSRYASALIFMSLFASSAAAVTRIVDRHRLGFDNLEEDVFDGLTVAANLFSMGTLSKLKWTQQGWVMTRTARAAASTKFFLWGELTTTGAEGLLLAKKHLDEFKEIMEDTTLRPSERLQKLLTFLQSAAITGTMAYVSWRSTKADLDDLDTKGFKKDPRTSKEKHEHLRDRTKKDDPLDALEERPSSKAKKEEGKPEHQDETDTRRRDKKPENATPPAKKKPARPRPFEGPDPQLNRRLTRKQLQSAIDAVKAGKSTYQQREDIAQYLAMDVRQVLHAPAAKANPPFFSGACGTSTCLFWRRFEQLGVSGGVQFKLVAYQSTQVWGNSATTHAFAIVEIGGDQFLLDTTMRQFFNRNAKDSGMYVADVGEAMRSLEGGDDIADDILREGFTLLTDDVAKVYAHGMSIGKVSDFKAADFANSKNLNVDVVEHEGQVHHVPFVGETQPKDTPPKLIPEFTRTELDTKYMLPANLPPTPL